MSRKFILVSLTIVCLFFHFGSKVDAAATDQSLVSFSSGVLLIEKPLEYSPEWGSVWIFDENPKTGWCCPKGKILDNVLVIELAEKSVFDRLEFDTGHADARGRGAKDIIVELSDDGPTEGFRKIASVSLVDREDNQSFPVTVDKSGKWLRLTIQNNHGDGQWTELMDFRAFGKQLTKTPLPDVSGTYETNYNDFHLRQQETSVTGCYEYNKGLLNGDIEGRTVKFTWREPRQKGPAVIIFSSDGEKFFGFRWYEGKEDSRGEIWSGIKKSQDVGGCPHWAGRAQEQLTGPWQEGHELEYNNTKEQANELKLGEDIKGFFPEKGDQDWYKLIVNVPGKNIIRIDLSAVPEIDSGIEIYNEKGSRLKTYNAGKEGEAEGIVNLGVAEGTIYYIMVKAYNGINQNDSYTLKTQLTSPWQEGQEFELNNKKEQANELKLGEDIKGFFQEKGDQDWYKLIVNVPGKNIIRIDLSAIPEVDSGIHIYDEVGRQLKTYNMGEKGEAESIINLGVTEGIYYIEVKTYNGINQNDGYTLETQLTAPWQESQEFELNDKKEQANELKLERIITGYIFPENDDDWYTVTVPEEGLDILVVDLSAVPQVNLSLTLLDDAGKQLKKMDISDKGEEESMVRMKCPSGKFYVKVNGRQANTEESYNLRVGKPTVQPATAEEVSQALTRALDYLASEQAKEGYWSQSRNDYKVGIAGLALQAFIGGECAPKDYSSNINTAINFLKTQYHPSSEYQSGTKDRAVYGGLIAKGRPMYEHAIATLALIEALVEMNDLSLAPIIEDALQLIIRAQNTEHKPELLGGPINVDSKNYGGWRYNPDSTDSDISITDWQILALKGALSAGFSIPDWSLPKAADYLRSLYHEDYHSFGYSSPGGGCARAGMGVLGLQLCGYPDDPRINPALRYMQDNPPVWENEEPGDGYPFYYWYYGSRAMLLAGGEYWRIWKDWTCRLLVDHQNGDGSWTGAQKEEGMEVYTTALGALMLELCCGHLPVYMHEKVRIPIMPGLIKVNFMEGLAQETTKNVELILDASNSMWGQIKGESKISIAKEALKQIIVGLPEDLNVGLRLYGHRYKVEDERACQDTELIIPIGPLQKDQLIQTIEKITPRGKTPLVYSILQSPQDFTNLRGGTVVLISDGIESCEGDIESIASKLKESGIELTVNIIGFGIKEEEARKQLETIAKSTGGIYLDAKDSQELLSSIQQTLKIEYDLIDEKRKVKASGYVGGEAVSILEGEYILQLKLEPTLLEIKVIVNPAKTSIFLLKREEGKWTIKQQNE